MTDRKPFFACGFCGVKISPVIGCNTINIPDIPPSSSAPSEIVVKRFNCSMMYSVRVDVSYFRCYSRLFLSETNETMCRQCLHAD